MAKLRTRATPVAALLCALAACHPGAPRTAARRPSESVPGAGVRAGDLTAAVSALCQARDEAGTTPAGARDTFYVAAHQRLHLEAAALDRANRPAAGQLLIDMQRVEADLAGTPPAPSLGGDLATLTATAADGLGRIRVQPPSCASS